MTTHWQQRILELEQSGLSLKEIGEKVGLAKSTISEIKSGASRSPTGDAAVELYLLHKKRCKARKSGKQVA